MILRFSLLAPTIALATAAAAAPPAAIPAMPGGLEPPGFMREAAKPAFGSYGIDTAGMDKAIAPGNDFYGYVNGTWAKTTPIPADKASYGAFDLLQDVSRERTHGILEEEKAKGSRIGLAYAAFLDTATIEDRGLDPIRPWLDRISGLKDRAGYPALVAEAARNGVPGPFAASVTQDAKVPERYTLGLRQSGLGLPDRDYYLSADPKLAAVRAAYQAHIARMLGLAGEPDAEARARALVDHETAIARVSWTRTDSRNVDKTYNRRTLAELTAAAPGFDFAAYFNALGIPSAEVVVGEPTAIAAIARLTADAPLAVLRDQLLIRSLDGFAAVLPAAFDRERFNMFGTVISGTPQQPERWKRAVIFTSDAVTDDVSKLYVARYFPPATKAAVDDLVKNIIAAMGARIDRLDWMTAETKRKAHAKLAAFTPRIGYPSQWHDYAGLKIVAGDAFGNMLRANQWRHDWNAQKFGKPIYRWEWGLDPMTVNAQANPTLVAITFPAAILQPPFFDPAADPAVNYGGIGAVIGHEMSHHFDDQGAKFDATGRLTQWWTDADVAAFKARTDRLVAQYDAYEPLPGMHVKGALTLGENTADLAGLAAAYDAYHASLKGGTAPVIDGTTGDQRFYLGWAQIWRQNHRENDLRNRLLTDPHAPSEQRVWIVRDMAPWYDAFAPKPDARLYLAPDARVVIW